MKRGWPVKRAAEVLGISPTKVTQAIEPAFYKVARLMIADPMLTLTELQEVMERIVQAARSAESSV